MTSPAFNRLATGYWNVNLRSGANPGGLSGPGAVRDNLQLMLADVPAVAAETAASATIAVAAAAAAGGGATAKGTSGSTITIPELDDVVAFAFVEAGRTWVKGQTLLVSADADALNQFSGPIVALDLVAKTVSVKALHVQGEGEFSAWNLGLTAPIDGTLTGRVAALEQADVRFRADALFYMKEFL
ncbi:MAG: hypothetical protein U1C74_14790 [Phenylobacterium sp.]|nr:hypothetical protein [Phenylobacterium sp.]